MLLAGILLKIGGYGMFVVSLLGGGFNYVLGVVSLVGGSLRAVLAVAQPDIKSLVAYSRVVHIRLITFSIVTLSWSSKQASLAMIIFHGVVRSGLFIVATFSYERSNTRRLVLLHGQGALAPSIYGVWVVLLVGNISIPPSLGFVSELAMVSVILANRPMLALVLSIQIVLVVLYTLQLFTLLSHGPTSNTPSSSVDSAHDLVLGLVHGQWVVLSPIILSLLE